MPSQAPICDAPCQETTEGPPPVLVQTFDSSPPQPSGSDSGKTRGNPSITPRKFKRFFTPRTQPPPQHNRTRRVLFGAHSNGLNLNRTVQSSPVPPPTSWGQENDLPEFPREFKRHKVSHTVEAGSEYVTAEVKYPEFTIVEYGKDQSERLMSSPCPKGSPVFFGTDGSSDDEGTAADRAGRVNPQDLVKPVVASKSREGLSGQLLDMELGNLGRPGRLNHSYLVNDWRDLTGKFYSKPEGVHETMSLGDEPKRTIPFVAVGLNTTSLLAVGDEEGRVRLLETAKDGKPGFDQPVVGFRVHANAIINMTLSDDDSLLATASGDQSARVVDMVTQTTTAILGIHTASLKQVRFQPGANNKNILATAGRDGAIHIWDLRCSGYDGPQCRMWSPVAPDRPSGARFVNNNPIQYPRALSSILDAHKPLAGHFQPATAGWTDIASRGESSSRSESLVSRSSDVSVTALQFLPEGLDHLLLSACEADASIKLWDIRAVSSKKRTLPLAATAVSPFHVDYRDFGITSLNLSSDGSRFYALCKDNIVYAYSTSHVMHGHAPELDSANSRPNQKGTQLGQGPLYGLRNSKFHANTFYVKSALRKTQNGHAELLAVGSSNDCAVLFPTDERYFPQRPLRVSHDPFDRYAMPTIQVYDIGTPLIRGHDREVGSVAWTHGGELATVGDDLTVRLWREDYEAAKDLRTGGETDGRRWNCGWANVKPDFDDDDMEC
ncbi:related to lethal(2) denticleless protein [Phialocephala subalpina]|uniref:Related to lethal(2) denticleless protein n=1 Tax=Phialocephala subalpina TaxID=576137 RepID=A0A1L7WX76_9HELO|nr:related to lethal(2) denticleless protein [Phialocephala subalpina]